MFAIFILRYYDCCPLATKLGFAIKSNENFFNVAEIDFHRLDVAALIRVFNVEVLRENFLLCLERIVKRQVLVQTLLFAILFLLGERPLVEVHVAHQVILEMVVDVNLFDFGELAQFESKFHDESDGVSPGLVVLDVLLMDLVSVQIHLSLVKFATEAVQLFGRVIFEYSLGVLGFFHAVTVI